MADDKSKDDKPADKPKEDKPKEDSQSGEESVNMKILKQKKKVNEEEQKLKILETECNNDIINFNENRKKIQIQIISNNYEVVNADISECRINEGASTALWVGHSGTAVGPARANCQTIIPDSNGQLWHYSPMDKFMIDPRNINDNILERRVGQKTIANFMNSLPGSTFLKQMKIQGLEKARAPLKATTKTGQINRAFSAASNVFGFIVLLGVLLASGIMIGGLAAFLPLIISVILSLLINLAGKEASMKIQIGNLKGAEGRQLLPRDALNQDSVGDNSAYLELSNKQISSGSTLYDNLIGFINQYILDNKQLSKTLNAANQGVSTREFVEASYEGTEKSEGLIKTVVIAAALVLIIVVGSTGGAGYMLGLIGLNNIAWPLIKGVASFNSGTKMTPKIGSGKITKIKVENVKESLDKVNLSKNESLEKQTVSDIRKLMEIDTAKQSNEKGKAKIITKLNAKAKELSRVNSGLFPEFSKYMNYWVGSRTAGGMQHPAVGIDLAAMKAAALVLGNPWTAAQFSAAITAAPGPCAGLYYGTNVALNAAYSLNDRLAVQPELSTPPGKGLDDTVPEDYSGIFTLGDYSNLLNTIREDFNVELSEKAVVLEKIKTRWDETESVLTQIKNNLNSGVNTSTNIFAPLNLEINTLEYGVGRTAIVVEDTMNLRENVTAFKKTIELMEKRVTDNEQKLTEYYTVLKEEYKKDIIDEESGDKGYAKIPELIACSDEQAKKISKNLSNTVLGYIKDIGIVGRGRIGNRDHIGIIYKVVMAAHTANVAGGPTAAGTRNAAGDVITDAATGVDAKNAIAAPNPFTPPNIVTMMNSIVAAGVAVPPAQATADQAGSLNVLNAIKQATLEVFVKDIGDTPILHPTKGGPAGNTGILTEEAYAVKARPDPPPLAINALNTAHNNGFEEFTAASGRLNDCQKQYFGIIHNNEDRRGEFRDIRDALAAEADKIRKVGAYAAVPAVPVVLANLNAADDHDLAHELRTAINPGPTNQVESVALAALEAETAYRFENFAYEARKQYVPAGWENAKRLEDVYNFNEDERHAPYFELYFRINRGIPGNAGANRVTQKSYDLTTVKHIMGKAKILYLLEKYERQEKILLPEKEKLKELEKMKKELKSKGLSLTNRLSGFKKDLKGNSEIVVKILKRNGLGDKVGVIKSAYGITVGSFLNLAKDTSICGEIGKKYGFTSLENKAFVVSVKEVEEYNKTREKEAEETKKETEKTAKEEKDKSEKTDKKEDKKEKEKEKEKLTEDLKEEIKETNQPEEEKQKKLETLNKIDKIDKEQKVEDKKEDTESEIKIKQLTKKTEKDIQEIKNLTNETELTKKAINEVVKELQKSRRGSIEFTEHARELLIDHLGRLKKRRDIQEKKLSDMVYEKERVSQLLNEMQQEEQLIIKERSQLEGEKQKFREQQRLALLDKAKMEQTIRQLEIREKNQKKRSLRKLTNERTNKRTNEPNDYGYNSQDDRRPISYTSSSTSREKGKIRTPRKIVKPAKKPKQFTRKKPKREKKESFIESLTPDFLKTQ